MSAGSSAAQWSPSGTAWLNTSCVAGIPAPILGRGGGWVIGHPTHPRYPEPNHVRLDVASRSGPSGPQQDAPPRRSLAFVTQPDVPAIGVGLPELHLVRLHQVQPPVLGDQARVGLQASATLLGLPMDLRQRIEGPALLAVQARHPPLQGPVAKVGRALGGSGELGPAPHPYLARSEEHTSELQSRFDIVCRLLLEKKKS